MSQIVLTAQDKAIIMHGLHALLRDAEVVGPMANPQRVAEVQSLIRRFAQFVDSSQEQHPACYLCGK